MKCHTSQSENSIRVAEALQKESNERQLTGGEKKEQQSQENHLRAGFEEETRAGCCGCELFSSSSLCLLFAQKN